MTDLHIHVLNNLFLWKSMSFVWFTTYGSFDSLLNIELTVLQLPWSCNMKIAMNIDHNVTKSAYFF